MNRDLLDALGALAAEFYFDALERYPTLMGPGDPDGETLVVWAVVLHLDELFVCIQTAQQFDDSGHRPLAPSPQEELPF